MSRRKSTASDLHLDPAHLENTTPFPSSFFPTFQLCILFRTLVDSRIHPSFRACNFLPRKCKPVSSFFFPFSRHSSKFVADFVIPFHAKGIEVGIAGHFQGISPSLERNTRRPIFFEGGANFSISYGWSVSVFPFPPPPFFYLSLTLFY